MTRPIVQVAVDATDLTTGRAIASDAVAAGADWIEVGYPLIKFEGIRALRQMREDHPDAYLLADLMILAGSRRYVTMAAELGINNVTVTALAPDHTVEEAIVLGRASGIDVTVDLFNKADLVTAAVRYQEMGASFVMVHFGVDQKRMFPAGSPLDTLAEVVAAVSLPVSYATYDLEEARLAVRNGASVIVQGEPLTSAPDRLHALQEFIEGVRGPETRRS